jgi:U3 small nucleolar RNA-associated protein 13
LADYKNAILLALSMDQPRRLFNLFKAVSASRAPLDASTAEDGIYTHTSQTITGNAAVDQVIRTLPLPELGRLLRHIRDWNATSRTSGIAQTVLHAVLKLRRAEDVRAAFVVPSNINFPPLEPNDGATPPTQKAAKAGDGLRDVVEALIPYTERQLARTERMVQDSYVLDFLIGEMDRGVVLDEDDMDVDI